MENNIKKISVLTKSFKSRLSWDEYFMSVALLISSRSSCDRLHVGCVLVKNNRIISSGYNGFLTGVPHESCVVNNHEQNTVHAEQNCISDCAMRGVSSNDTIAYITHYPCINCSKILSASGIKKIFYNEEYKNSDISRDILKISNIDIIKIG
jgi:dCMP deaminase